jgi:hypothetical protein
MSACSTLAKEQYIKRHDRVVLSYTSTYIRNWGVILDSELWYEHIPKSVETSQVGKVNHIMESTSANRQNHPQQ